MILNDMQHVPGFELVRAMPYGAALFEGDDTRLTVIMANRGALEAQFGADLIYYNETYSAFVIVQYKAMEMAPNEGAIFRLPNANLSDEITRMEGILVRLRQCSANTASGGYRLMENPFFLKLCPRLIFNPDDVALIKGMYLPLGYWRLLETDPILVGPKGGRRITFENVRRYLDNTSFVALMSKGWIGTTPTQSQLLENIIRVVIQSNRTLTIAVKTGLQPEEIKDLFSA